MLVKFNITGIACNNVVVEPIHVHVEYTPDELLAILREYPSIITAVSTLLNQAKGV